MVAFLILFTIIFAFTHGVSSRACGGGPYSLPYGLDQWIYAAPFAVLALLVTQSYAVTATVLITTMLAKRFGHGQYMDLGFWTNKVEAREIDILFAWLVGEDQNTIQEKTKGNYWRDFIGLAVSGALIALPTAVVTGVYYSLPFALLLLLGGAGKSIAYVIGWEVNGVKNLETRFGKHYDEATEVGEFMTGFILGIPLFLIIGYVILFG